MSNEAIIITLLTLCGFLVAAIVGFYIASVEGKFNDLKTSINEIKNLIGMRKMYGTIEQRKQGGLS